MSSDVDIGPLPISEWRFSVRHICFRYRTDVFQSDIYVSNIRITDVDIGCRISPTLRSMSMPTYGCSYRFTYSSRTRLYYGPYWPETEKRYCALHRSGLLPGTRGKWGQRGEGGWEGWGRAWPPRGRKDKQSVLSKGRDNMSKGEGARGSWAWLRRIDANRVSGFSEQDRRNHVINVIMIAKSILISCFCFRRKNHIALKTICIDPLSTRCCTSRREQGINKMETT
jgi:hypothetical protein